MMWNVYKNMKWSKVYVPVKVEQIDDDLFSDTVPSQKSIERVVKMNDYEMIIR